MRKIKLLITIACVLILVTSCTVSKASGFSDVPDDAWYKSAVEFVSGQGYFTGISETDFAPDLTMNRAMFVTVIGRMEESFGSNAKKDTNINSFTDVDSDSYYEPYVSWAVSNNIVKGYPDGSFKPYEAVTNEQMAVLLSRFEKYKQLSLTQYSLAPEFKDASSISEWAREDVEHLRQALIINRDSNSNFNPSYLAIRSEAAWSVMQFCISANGSELSIPDAFPTRDKALEILNGMTLHEKIYQLFVVWPEKLTDTALVTQAGELTREKIEARPVGGIVYKAQNLVNPEQVIQMIENTKSYSKIPLIISVDEEGGAVARVADKLGTTKFNPMYSYRNDGPAKAHSIGETLANDIKQFGFNVDYAPVADVWTNQSNKVIGTRSFGSDPNKVAEMVAEEVRGMQGAEIASTIKHFPGHGNTDSDTHTGTVYSNRTLDELRSCEFIPFKSGIAAGASSVMVAHIIVPSVDSNPASMSYTLITDILRNELQFNGVVITDAMEMGAIAQSYTSGDAAVKALQAGVDIILCPDTLDEAANAIMDAINNGLLSESRINESVLRILKLKQDYNIIP